MSMLGKVIVGRYYKVNLGFFLVLLLMLFGLLDGRSTMRLHYGIMLSVMESWAVMATILLVWVLYNIKCMSFTFKQLSIPENEFIYTLQGIAPAAHRLQWLSCQAMLQAPTLVYGVIAVIVGISNAHWLPAIVFLLFMLLLLLVTAEIYVQKINATYRQPSININLPKVKLKKKFFFYLVYYSLEERKSGFILIKVFSIILLQGMVLANTDHTSKEAICFLIMFLISGHALLPWYYVRFMEESLAFSRNLPINLGKRLGVFVITYAIIFLPEILFLLVNEKETLNIQTILSLYILSITQSMFYTSVQYFRALATERYMMIVFGLFFAGLLFLATANIWALATIEAVAGIAIYATRYYKYESLISNE